jgi:dynein heavy chain
MDATALRNTVIMQRLDKKACCRSSFKDVGKGWYHLGETNWQTYEFSKLRRLLILMRLMMQDTLRGLAEDSMARFLSFMQVRT